VVSTPRISKGLSLRTWTLKGATRLRFSLGPAGVLLCLVSTDAGGICGSLSLSLSPTGCPSMYVYYCRTYENAVSGGGSRRGRREDMW